MSILFKYIANFLTGEDDVMSHEEVLALKNEAQEEEPKAAEKTKNIVQNACFHKHGMITELKGNCGFIDKKFYFRKTDVKGLKVGMQVYYLAYEEHGEMRISKILSVVDSDWKDEEQMTFWYKKIIVTQVIHREGRIIYTSDNIECDLDNVRSEFVPIVGDWLQMESIVEANKNAFNYEGTVLDVKSISPTKIQKKLGTIRHWDEKKKEGSISPDIYFNISSLNPGYMPVNGDKVIVEVIESQQNRCKRRALKVVPDTITTKNNLVVKTDNGRNLINNKNGICISQDIVVNLMKLRETADFQIEVNNQSNTTHKLQKAAFKNKSALLQLCVTSPVVTNIELIPNETVVFKFSCYSRFMGTTKELFIFTFDGFEIGRWITIKIIPKMNDNVNKGYSSNMQKNIVKLASNSMLGEKNDILLGQKPIKPPSFIANKLPVFEVPASLMKKVFHLLDRFRTTSEIPPEEIALCLTENLCFSNYENRFHHLLHLEEIALKINMHKYDMDCAVFTKSMDFMLLEVEDLSERKPSVIIGDRVIVTNTRRADGERLEGFVHKISSKHVHIKFHPTFHARYNGEDYKVQFQFSRSSFRRYHQAVSLAVQYLRQPFLFPTKLIINEVQLIFECEDDEHEEAYDQLQINAITAPESRTLNYIRNLKLNQSNVESNEDNASCSADHTNDAIGLNNSDNTQTKEKSPVAKVLLSLRSNQKENSIEEREEVNYVTPVDIEEDLRKVSVNPKKQTIAAQKRMLKRIDKTRDYLKNFKKPTDAATLIKTCPVKLEWFNKKLNDHQKQAVKNILKGQARHLPYIIFGPPGTGKTITLIETVLQILRMLPHSRLLIAAPSNSAADLVALRLLDSGVLSPGELVRMVAFRCVTEGTIPSRLKPYCVTADIAKEGSQEIRGNLEDGVVVGQYMSALGRHRVTVGTCMIVGSFYTMGFPRGHFSHVLIDEAGQATEPETLIPMSLLDVNNSQVILAGDPCQLGPCVFSMFSSMYGLAESFLERLIQRFPYTKDIVGFPETGGYDPRLVTKLVQSYRSLPDILQLSNMLFYNSELRSMVSSTDSEEARLLVHLSGFLPGIDGPPPCVIFHGVRGENFQMPDSPSWFNSAEASQVFFYINDLYSRGVSQSDIGIISPYIKQCQQIRCLLLESDLPLPKVGSVEEFQGQEFKIVIVSTVRSNETGAKKDTKFDLGFISSPRRVNVAISRAQALLIVVGNPHLLCSDSTWRGVLMYAIQMGGYVGCDLPDL